MSKEIEGYNRDTLLAMLQNRIVAVKFRKADGDLRVVRGTLLDEYLPAKYRSAGITPDDLADQPPTNVVTLWDVDESNWRSVRTDRIIEVL